MQWSAIRVSQIGYAVAVESVFPWCCTAWCRSVAHVMIKTHFERKHCFNDRLIQIAWNEKHMRLKGIIDEALPVRAQTTWGHMFCCCTTFFVALSTFALIACRTVGRCVWYVPGICTAWTIRAGETCTDWSICVFLKWKLSNIIWNLNLEKHHFIFF